LTDEYGCYHTRTCSDGKSYGPPSEDWVCPDAGVGSRDTGLYPWPWADSAAQADSVDADDGVAKDASDAGDGDLDSEAADADADVIDESGSD
jgi:hypothetical protein